MKRPEHLDRDARLLPEKPLRPSSHEVIVWERGENARFAKELEERSKKADPCFTNGLNMLRKRRTRMEGHDLLAKAFRILRGEGA